MTNLNEIDLREDADEAEEWAVVREYDLRYKSYQLAQLGVAGVFALAAEAARRFAAAVRGLDG